MMKVLVRNNSLKNFNFIHLMMNAYKISGSIIEFFWFLSDGLIFLIAIVINFYLKEEIHPLNKNKKI